MTRHIHLRNLYAILTGLMFLSWDCVINTFVKKLALPPVYYSGSNEQSLAPLFKWLDNKPLCKSWCYYFAGFWIVFFESSFSMVISYTERRAKTKIVVLIFWQKSLAKIYERIFSHFLYFCMLKGTQDWDFFGFDFENCIISLLVM